MAFPQDPPPVSTIQNSRPFIQQNNYVSVRHYSSSATHHPSPKLQLGRRRRRKANCAVTHECRARKQGGKNSEKNMWTISLLSLLLAVMSVTAGGGVSGNDELADPFLDISETVMLEEHGGADSPARFKRSTTGLACRGFPEKRRAPKR